MRVVCAVRFALGILVFGDAVNALVSASSELSALQHKLMDDLFAGYNRDSHPGGNATVMVSLGAKLARLVKVEEVNNVIKAQWWMKQVWSNPDLRWNKSEYGNIDAIYVEPTKVWVPDILLYNNGDEKVDAAGGTEKFKTKIKLSSDGTHLWLAPTMFTSICKMDIKFFPFDEQHCELEFGSWSYDSSKIDIEIDQNETKIHREVYQENNEWNVVSLKGRNRSKRYPCCENNYTNVIVILHMKRRSYHYLVNLVFPCTVIAAMVFCTFFLPAESGERISLCITVLMAMTIFQELTSEKLPVSSEGFILIEMYYTSCIVSISLAILTTCIVLNFYYKTTAMPRWVQRLILGWLARIFGVKTRLHKKQNDESLHTISNSRVVDNGGIDNNMIILKSISTIGTQNNSIDVSEPGEEKVDACILSNGVTNEGIKKRSVKSKKEQASATTYKEFEPSVNNVEDWRTASRIIDRVCVVIGFVLAIATTVGIFLQAPRVRDFIFGS